MSTEEKKIFPRNVQKVFFTGILGSSMSGLAIYCKEAGYFVAGSDVGDSPETEMELREKDIAVFHSHRAENAAGFDCLVYSAAIDGNNPEIAFFRKNGFPVISRAELLGKIAAVFERSVGVSGTHGKSTVCGFCASVFGEAGENPVSLIGAKTVAPEGERRSGGKIGKGTLIFEACEYKRSFLKVRAETAVVLNIEKEHVDCYSDVKEAERAFSLFAGNAKRCVLSYDNENVRNLEVGGKEKVYFSLENEKADVCGKITGIERGYYSFDTYFEGKYCFGVRLNVPGIHNVTNALAAAACARLYGIGPEKIKSGLLEFRGMKRRFEYVGRCGRSLVFDDYAHHPTELRATLKAAREMGYKRIVCAFQPHTFSRTGAFFAEFAEVFSEYAAVTVFADIFAAREENRDQISSEALAKATRGGIYEPDFNRIAKILALFSGEDTLILTLGAGKLDLVAKILTSF